MAERLDRTTTPRPTRGLSIIAAERERVVDLLTNSSLTIAEIAAVVGRPVNTVYSFNQRHRIRRYLNGNSEFVNREGERRSTIPTFESFVHKRAGHWFWKGPVSSDGYARIRRNGRRQYAARLAWEREFGKIPDGYVLAKTCAAKGCISPEHHKAVLMREVVQRGAAAKLTPHMVSVIRSCKTASARLAKRYGVSRRQINRIRQGTRWLEIGASK